MKKVALRHAQYRLSRAAAAHAALLRARSFDEAEFAWTDFLIAASTIYSKLDKGSKGQGKSEAWFGRMKHERKTDQLLSYIHQARNTDEHGIDPVTSRSSGSFQVFGDVTINGSLLSVSSYSPVEGRPLPQITIRGPHITLVPVTNYNDTFQVPNEHLGKPLKEQSPTEIATLALTYLKWLVNEGSKFTK